MASEEIRIIGQEHRVIRPDGAGIPTDITVPAGIVVEVGGQIVSLSMRKRLGLEDTSKADSCPTDTTASRKTTSISRWGRVENPSGGRRLIG